MSWQAGPHPDDPPRRASADVDADIIRRHYPRRTPVVIRPRADTPQVSALILLPLLVPALSLMSVMFAGGWSLSTVTALAALTAVIQFLVARRDRIALGRRGFVDQAPAVLALLSPILYLHVRAGRCEGHDPDAAAPVRWAIGSTAIAVVVIIVATWFHAAITEGLAQLTSG